MTALGLQLFLAYPAVIKLRHGGAEQFRLSSEGGGFCQLPVTERAFAAAPQDSRKAAAAFSSARREGLDGRVRGDAAARKRWWREGYGCLLDLFFLSSSFSSWDSVHIYSIQLSLCW